MNYKSFYCIKERTWIHYPKLCSKKENRKPFFLFHKYSFDMREGNENCQEVKTTFNDACNLVKGHVVYEVKPNHKEIEDHNWDFQVIYVRVHYHKKE